MSRAIDLYFCDFDHHIDLSFLDDFKVNIRKTLKGDPTPSGTGELPYNVISIEYAGSDLPDEYDSRINALIGSIGGEDAIRKLVLKYQARIAAVTLGIPTRTGDTIEDSYISQAMMEKLCALKLDIHFYYT